MHPSIQHIVEFWYLSEGALFQIFGTHNLVENSKIDCPFRCGRGIIEYNEDIINKLDEKSIEMYLKAEVIRILLKHPYDRQPDGCKRTSMAKGSNLVLADNYDFSQIGLQKPENLGLEKNQSYEWYSFRMEEMDVQPSTSQKKSNDKSDDDVLIKTEGNNNTKALDVPDNSPSSEDGSMEIQLPDGTILKLPSKNAQQSEGSKTNSHQRSESNGSREEEARDFSEALNNGDIAQLWEEDSLMSCAVDVAVDEIESNNAWGSLAGTISDMILANTKAKIDYRKVLAGFRSSILSTKRHLTRMRPNRRSGLDNMGSTRRFNTNILVAVDVSGSVDNNSLRHFYSIVNRAFKYGIENIDVIQFDTELKEVEKFDKAQKNIHVLGRGGTSFQPIIDYVAIHQEYDGLLVFTDGYAPMPKLSKNVRCKIAWICNTQKNYNKNKQWMQKIGRCCAIQI